MPKKVLIVYATGGMGHVTAAKAAEAAFKEKYPDVEVKNIDVIDFANAFYKKFFVDGYNYVSSNYPGAWGWLYRRYNDKSRQKLPTLVSRLAIERKFIQFVKEFAPDFIISTHPLPMLLISHSKQQEVTKLYSSLVVTDFGCHSFWVDEEVNYYFTATEEVGKCLGGYGVKPEQVVVTGIPIHLKFSQAVDRDKVIKKLNLRPDLKTVMIVGGQFSFEALNIILSGVKKKHQGQVQFLVIAGRDKDLEESLNKSDLGQDPLINVYGFVDNMEEMMTVSDLIFSKAGGLTVSECMAKGLPMVINKVIPGQEEDNVDYLVSKGAAIKADDFDGIVKHVNELLSNPNRITQMQSAAKSIGRPKSAISLADFVMKKLQ